jgi:hypothetical protein
MKNMMVLGKEGLAKPIKQELTRKGERDKLSWMTLTLTTGATHLGL